MLPRTNYHAYILVRPRGLEPPQISPQAPQACAATNYATDANFVDLYWVGLEPTRGPRDLLASD